MNARDLREMSDQALAGALAGGEVAALGELYDRYGSLSFAVAVRVVGDPGRAEDVVQEAFLKVWRGAAGFDAARGSLRGWLLASVRNRAIDSLRGRGAHEQAELELRPEIEATGTGSDPWREVSRSLERAAIQEALASLPSEQRQAIELAYYGGYSYAEIAEMSRVPLSTIKGRARLALEKLHSYLVGRGLVGDAV
ncbi:MAG TPA: sigma-70 family RNA polymerase sigma factor [Candidatus Dormibacteraeota bacterium]